MCLLPVVMSHCEDSGENSHWKKRKGETGRNCRSKIAQYSSYSWRLWWFKGSPSLKHDTLSHSEEQKNVKRSEGWDVKAFDRVTFQVLLFWFERFPPNDACAYKKCGSTTD